jgi:hypothetical protein
MPSRYLWTMLRRWLPLRRTVIAELYCGWPQTRT